MVARPQPEEYTGFDATYVARVPEHEDVFEVLRRQPDQLRALLQNTWDDQASRRPKPGEGSIKEVIGHICDQERVFAYRLMRIARCDKTLLPVFYQYLAVNGKFVYQNDTIRISGYGATSRRRETDYADLSLDSARRLGMDWDNYAGDWQRAIEAAGGVFRGGVNSLNDA